MNTLTTAQHASLARACTALRMALNKGHLTMKAARVLLAGDAKTAAGELGLTLTRRNGETVHDLSDSHVVWFLTDCLEARKLADVTEALKGLRAECHAAIDRSKI